MPGQTMREAMDDAFDASEEVEEVEEGSEEVEEEEEVEDGEEKEGTDEGEGTGEPEEEGDPDEDKVVDEPKSESDESKPPTNDSKAPASWTPKAREHWNKLPQEIQEEVARRETEINRGLQQASGYRKVAEEYQNLMAPYQSLITSQNSTPGQTISNLMGTAARLLMGTPAQKAQVVSEIIQNYGVDVYQLDTVLSGQELPDDPNAQLGAMLDKRLAPMTQFMDRIQYDQDATNRTSEESAQSNVETFAANAEFYEDVREDMADLMDLAANRKRELTLEDAYDRCCSMHPEISKIISARKVAESSTLNGASLAKKKAASSSVRGSRGSSSAGEGSNDRMGSIRDAWDDAEG